MCGISGYYTFKEQVDLESKIKSLVDSLKHRGPDESSFKIINSALAFGHNLLAIMDMSGCSKQPFQTEGSSYLTYNGEIFNLKSLWSKYEINNKSSDTTTLAEGIDKYGFRFLDSLSGMYSFGFWNSKTSELFLSRDHVGIKPLYYYVDEEKCIFASELQAILKVLPPQELDIDGIHQFFHMGFITSPNTAFKKIKQVMPGSTIKISENGIETVHQLKIQSKDEKEDLGKLIKEISLNHLVGKPSPSLLLSGGIDSSILAWTLKDEYKVNYGTLENLYDGDSEVDKAKTVAETCRRDLTTYKLKKINFKFFKQILASMDDLICDPAIISNFLIYEKIKGSTKVIIQGDGADELFYGYHTHIFIRFLNLGILEILKHPINLLIRFLKLFLKEQKKYPFLSKLERLVYLLDYPAELRPLILRSPILENKWLKNINMNYINILAKNNFKPLDVDFYTYLEGNILKKVDRLSMANSLEVRVPYLDRRVVSHSMGLPDKLKLKKFKTKIPLRDLVKTYFGKSLSSQKKVGFGYDLEKLFKEIGEKNILSLVSPDYETFFMPESFENLVKKKRTFNESYSLFCMICFNLWLERNKNHISSK